MKSVATFLSDRAELARLEPFTADFARAAGLGDRDLFALQVIVEELVTNVIDYGGVPEGELAVEVELETDGNHLHMRFTDRGRPYNPLEREDPDTTLPAEERPIGGLGIFFCKKLTEAQEYRREPGANVLTLHRVINSEA